MNIVDNILLNRETFQQINECHKKLNNQYKNLIYDLLNNMENPFEELIENYKLDSIKMYMDKSLDVSVISSISFTYENIKFTYFDKFDYYKLEFGDNVFSLSSKNDYINNTISNYQYNTYKNKIQSLLLDMKKVINYMKFDKVDDVCYMDYLVGVKIIDFVNCYKLEIYN